MKAILLNGSHANDSTGERVRAALTAQLETQGWDCDRARDLRNVCATGGIRVGGFAGIGWRSNAQWRTIRIRQSLELAAEALAQGQPIPQAARDIMAKPVIPHWVYSLMAWFGWHQGAKQYGAQELLKRQPYLAKAK